MSPGRRQKRQNDPQRPRKVAGDRGRTKMGPRKTAKNTYNQMPWKCSRLQPAERARVARVREPSRDCQLLPACGSGFSCFSCVAVPLGARAPALPLLRCSCCSCVACSAWGSLASRASRSMIARFIFGPKSTVFTVFEALLAQNSSFSTTLGVEK